MPETGRRWGPNHPLYNEWRFPFLHVKRPGRGSDNPPPFNTEVKERIQLYFNSPSGTSWPVQRWTLPLSLPCPVHRDLLYLYLYHVQYTETYFTFIFKMSSKQRLTLPLPLRCPANRDLLYLYLYHVQQTETYFTFTFKMSSTQRLTLPLPLPCPVHRDLLYLYLYHVQ